MTAVVVDDMKEKLLTLDQVREKLSVTEPLGAVTFPVGETIRFQIDQAWNHGVEAKAGTDRVDAYVSVGVPGASTEFQLTKDSLLEATSICGIPKGYATRTPARLIEPQLNYWFREGLAGKEYKLLSVGDDLGAAFTRATVSPFSNLRLLDQALDGIESYYGAGEVLADYKFTHTLRRTAMRLIVPERERVIQNTGTDNDTWSVGLQVANSLIGDSQTEINGYLFRWWCTNGAIDTLSTSGTWSRRTGGQGDEVYDWAREAVDNVLGGLEHALDAVQSLTEIPIVGETTEVLRDVFQQYRIPVPEREAIINNMLNEENLTMYSLMQAVTQAANGTGVDPAHVEALMRAGGDLPHSVAERCEACRRLQVNT